MLLDFKEIPQANTGSGLQDTFELFTRDFLQYLGYRILENPNRGADGKKDMIVEEVFKGGLFRAYCALASKLQALCTYRCVSKRSR